LIRVAVAGAAGRMGATVCRAVEGAEDLELVARADPALELSVSEALDRDPDVLVDFTVPSCALDNVQRALTAGVHAVVGTTGFDLAALGQLRGASANVFVAPNFAIGAVLMMQFSAQAAQHMAAAALIGVGLATMLSITLFALTPGPSNMPTTSTPTPTVIVAGATPGATTTQAPSVPQWERTVPD